MADSRPEHTSLMSQEDHFGNDRSKSNIKTKSTFAEIKNTTQQRPFWLGRTAPLSFCILFIACAIALIILDRHIASINGLPLMFSSSEYSWTYGPTAILVIILSFWRRIDYYVKSTQPWREMLTEPTPAERSLLLDYICPFQGLAMIEAFKLRHLSVFTTILCFFLLKLIILVSTSLFAVEPSLHTGSFTVQYQNSFDRSGRWKTLAIDSPVPNPYDVASEGGSDEPIWAYVAKLNNVSTNDHGWASQYDLTTQRFNLPTPRWNVTSIEAPVDVFIPKVACEEATLSMIKNDPPNDNLTSIIYKYNSATCSGNVVQLSSCNETESYCPPKSQEYTLHSFNCSGSSDDRDDGSTMDDTRYAITVAQYTLEASPSTIVKSIHLDNYSSVICDMGYGIVSPNVTHNLLTGEVVFPDNAFGGETTMLFNTTNKDLVWELLADLGAAGNTLTIDSTFPGDGIIDSDSLKILLQLVLGQLGDHVDKDILLQPSILRRSLITVIKGVMAEIAQKTLLLSDDTEILVDGLISENRLHTRPVALWIMVAGFFSLAAACIFLLFKAQHSPWIPAMSGSIAVHAAILTNSPSLQDLLSDAGGYRGSQLKRKLDGTQFEIVSLKGGLTLEVIDESVAHEEPSTEKTAKKKRRWMPLSARIPMIYMALYFPMLMIFVLEILKYLSDKRNGLLDLKGKDSTNVSYVVRISSTLVAFAIATIFNNLDFTIATFTPYSSLRSGNAQSDRSILFHILSVSPFLVLIKSLRKRQYGAAASNLSTLIGSTLTIIVSGLWTSADPIVSERSSTASLNNWDQSWLHKSYDDGGAATRLNLIRHGGADIPTEIWKDFVMPNMSISSTSQDSGVNYTYEVRALQPILNCTVIPSNNLSSEVTDERGINPVIEVTVHAVVPPECSDKHMGNLTFGIEVWDLSWVGQYLDLKNSTSGQIRAACPSIGILFGLAELNGTLSQNLTALVCSQGIQEVPVTITYTGNPSSGAISRDHPPRLESQKAWKWHNGTSGADTMGFKLADVLNAELAPFEAETVESKFDPFFNHLLFGPNGTSRDELVGPENTDNLIDAVTQSYKEYMTLVYHFNLRARSNSTKSSLINAAKTRSSGSLGSASKPTTKISGKSSQAIARLAIHTPSKIILQAELAAMTILGLVGYLLVKLRGTLPRNPTNIASAMAFLAGSQLCHQGAGIIPKGAELMNERHLRQMFEGWVFSLGWWKIEDFVTEEDSVISRENTSASRSTETLTVSTKDRKGYRFGVDVGRAS